MFSRSRAPLGVVLASSALIVTAACGSPSAGQPASSSAPPTLAPSSPGAPSSPAAPSSPVAPSTPATVPCVPDAEKAIKAPAPSTGPLPADLVAKLDAAAESSYKKASTPGAIVGVQTAQGTWTKAYGVADPKTDAPMKVGMHTRIGSLTKPFTVTAVLQLVEDGKLSLDDPIAKYVKGVPNGDRITLRMLANMTSGVASYSRSTKFTDVLFADPQKIWTHDQLIKIGLSLSPLFEPGAEFDYSNTNTQLLGKVLEKVTGKTAAEVITDQVLKPLDMGSSTWPGDSTKIPKPYPQGFTLQSKTATASNPTNSTHWNPSWQWTAGEIISTVDDLLLGVRAVGTGQGVVDPAIQAERLTSVAGPAGYGIGFGCGNGWVGHSGEVPGYSTSMFYDTKNDQTVVVQTNSDIASGNCTDSPTMEDDPRNLPCSAPAVRVLVSLTEVLGNAFEPPARK